MTTKTPEQLEADRQANEAERQRQAAEANKKRNDARVEAMNRIADNADEVKNSEDDLEDLTDEVWAQEERGAPKKTREQLIAEQNAREDDEEARAAAALLRKNGELDEDEQQVVADAQREDRALDEAREAGASDIRKNAQGVTEYKVEVNGKAIWLTIAGLRELAGQVAGGDDDDSGAGQGDEGGGKSPTAQRPDPAAAERRRQAEEAERQQLAAYKSKLKDLYTKASMGDEAAIDELAEIQSAHSRVTPDVLRIVDERVDARVTGRTAFNAAVEWFEGEYADELSTAALKRYAARRDRELADENPDMSPRKRLEMVGSEMRQLRTDLGGKPKPKVETKQQRKQGLPNVPSAGGRQRPETELDEQESTSDAIAGLARGRGQAHAIKH